MDSLEILNGELSPKYDKYNSIYTVNISNDVEVLELKYDVTEEKKVNIYGNLDFEVGQNKVVIAVSDEKNIEYITLIVQKKDVKNVSSSVEQANTINIKKETLPGYVAPLIGCLCFIFILFIYTIIFRKRGKKIKPSTII